MAHDIVHAFVTVVSLSLLKRSSAPVLAVVGVNDSPRRYDSEVMLTSIRSESGAPFWGSAARDRAHHVQRSGAGWAICLHRRAALGGEKAEAQRPRCFQVRPG